MYRQFRPCKELDPYVDTFFEFEHEKLISSEIREKFISQLNVILIFNLGASFRRTINNESAEIKNSVVEGVNTSSIEYLHNINNRFFGVSFKPLGISNFTDLPLNHFTDSVLDISDVFGKEIKTLEDKLFHTESILQRIKMISDFLISKLSGANSSRIEICSNAAAFIGSENNYNKSSYDICYHSNITERTLQRYFERFLGISPKTYLRIKRFNYIVKNLSREEDNLTDIFYSAGFTDQSHFIHDFRKFSGASPSGFLREIISEYDNSLFINTLSVTGDKNIVSVSLPEN